MPAPPLQVFLPPGNNQPFSHTSRSSCWVHLRSACSDLSHHQCFRRSYQVGWTGTSASSDLLAPQRSNSLHSWSPLAWWRNCNYPCLTSEWTSSSQAVAIQLNCMLRARDAWKLFLCGFLQQSIPILLLLFQFHSTVVICSASYFTNFFVILHCVWRT